MADLSAYVNFTFTIDKSGVSPVCLIADTSTYPAGVAATVTGFVKITQPDNVTRIPNFSVADISWNGTVLTVANIPYRLATNGAPQNGVYTVTYTVKAPGYSDTIVVKTLTLSFTEPAIIIAPLIDVFTPLIKVNDGTSFTQAGMTLTSSTRAWTVNIDLVGSTRNVITGNTATLDLKVGSSYYDALYTATLVYTFTYQLNGSNNWFYIVDKLTAMMQFDCYTPLTLSQLLTYLNTLKAAAADLGTGVSEITKSQYIKAESIYEHMISRGQVGDLLGLQVYEQQLESIFLPYRAIPVPHSNAPIPIYVWAYPLSVPSVTLPAGTPSWVAVAGTLVEKFVVIAPTALTAFSIGTTPGGSDLWGPMTVSGTIVLAGDKFFSAGATLYFTGIAADTVIKIYTR